MSDKVPIPKDAIKFLEKKQIVETEDWDDLQYGEHAHAFTVAHSKNAGILNDLFGMLNDAMKSGQSFQSFKKDMLSLMTEKGWYGRQDKNKDDAGYINWRTRLIYDVNMRTAYASGQYRQQLRGAGLRPIWVYKSKLAGENRRKEHIALHDKAFRYDDSFWNTFRPPNGWGCECFVVTLSESGAEAEGIAVLASSPDGTPPNITDSDGNPIDWKKFASLEWQYNPGLEAFAPDFSQYENLADYQLPDGTNALDAVIETYRNDMDNARMTEGELEIFLKRMKDGKYVPQNIIYQIGNLDKKRYEALSNTGIQDSKIVAIDSDLASVAGSQVATLYETLQSPESIYENTDAKTGREFIFTKNLGDGSMLKTTLYQAQPNTALRVVSVETVPAGTGEGTLKKIY